LSNRAGVMALTGEIIYLRHWMPSFPPPTSRATGAVRKRCGEWRRARRRCGKRQRY